MPPASLRTLRADETGKGNISLRCELLGSGREQFCNYLISEKQLEQKGANNKFMMHSGILIDLGKPRKS